MDDAMDAGRYGSYTGFRKPGGIIIAQSLPDDDITDIDYEMLEEL